MSREKQIEEIARITKAHCELDNQCGSCHWETCNDCFAEILYNAGYRKQEWINVEDRLPEQANHYLTVSEEGVYVRFYSNEWGWNYDFGEVTYWMPLPEPPKMKGGAK